MDRNKTNLKKPHILFVGPMLGINPGCTPCPAESIVPLLKNRGYECTITSTKLPRLQRLLDMVITLLKLNRYVDIICLQIYAYRSFIVEDIISFLAKVMKKKIIMVLHFGDFPSFMQRYPRWSKSVLKRANTIIAPSSFLQHTVMEYGFSAKVIPNVILIENYTFKYRENVTPTLIWMRKFYHYYNPILAIETLKQLKVHYPNANLTMAGKDKGLQDLVKEHVIKNGLSDSVRILEFLSMSKKQEEFSRHQICINTNNIDNMPISLLEAAAFGLPIVSTNVGGLPFLLHHEINALLVPPNNPTAMATAIIRLVEEPGLASRLSLAGRQLAESCSPDSVIPLWEEVFLN